MSNLVLGLKKMDAISLLEGLYRPRVLAWVFALASSMSIGCLIGAFMSIYGLG